MLLAGVACTSPSGQDQQVAQYSDPDSVVLVAARETPEDQAPAAIPAQEAPSVSESEPVLSAIQPAPSASKGTAPHSADTPDQPLSETASIPTKETPPAATAEVAEPVAAEPEKVPVVAPVAFSHTAWDQLLQKHVSAAGKVNYRGFKQDLPALRAYLEQLSTHPPESDWSRDQRLAYWINVYNAFTVKLIVDNYPTTSITTLEGGKPWNKRWIRIGDKTYSLDEVENAVIRKQFAEPRIHFAVNCASVSCPELLNRAYTADKLGQQLETQTRAYINNPTHNLLSENKPQVSQLFEWYAADFQQKDGSVVAFINRYAATKIKENATLTYKPYNWNLNE